MKSFITSGQMSIPLSFSIIIKSSSKTKVSNFKLHLIIDEEVAEFEISVNNVVTVEVLAC